MNLVRGKSVQATVGGVWSNGKCFRSKAWPANVKRASAQPNELPRRACIVCSCFCRQALKAARKSAATQHFRCQSRRTPAQKAAKLPAPRRIFPRGEPKVKHQPLKTKPTASIEDVCVAFLQRGDYPRPLCPPSKQPEKRRAPLSTLGFGRAKAGRSAPGT